MVDRYEIGDCGKRERTNEKKGQEKTARLFGDAAKTKKQTTKRLTYSTKKHTSLRSPEAPSHLPHGTLG